MLERHWHGWTTPETVDDYERLLREEVFAGLDEIDGYHGVRVLRRDDGDEVEFLTMMRFESLDAVEAFAGEPVEEAHVPPAAQELLTRYDAYATHYAADSTASPDAIPLAANRLEQV